MCPRAAPINVPHSRILPKRAPRPTTAGDRQDSSYVRPAVTRIDPRAMNLVVVMETAVLDARVPLLNHPTRNKPINAKEPGRG